MIIASGSLKRGSLSGQVSVVTGGGRGIGIETARSLAWLGATVIIAELNEATGEKAASALCREFGTDTIFFKRTDVGDVDSVSELKKFIGSNFGQTDVVINNATITPMGSVLEVPIDRWDASYRVNLRGPVLLAKAFLPGMKRRNQGVFISVSSVGLAYMGAYESFKAAQQHLAETLDAELEGTAISAFTVSPGMVLTPGAVAGIEQLAPKYGMSVEEFLAMSESHLLTAEEAGAGMAAAVALADQFNGQEISCKQALIAAGISVGTSPERSIDKELTGRELTQARELVRSVHRTLKEQSEGWRQRSFFERQWMLRDFRKNAGLSVAGWLEQIERLEGLLAEGKTASDMVAPLPALAAYYDHMADLAKGYTADRATLNEQLEIIAGWKSEVEALYELLASSE